MPTNPYESPAPLESVPLPLAHEMDVMPFESGHPRAVWAKVFLGCGILLSCISAVSSWTQISILQQAKLGQATEEALMLNDLREGLISFTVPSYRRCLTRKGGNRLRFFQ